MTTMSVLHNEYVHNVNNCIHCNENSGGNMTTMREEKSRGWEVDIFRFTESHGWQQQTPLADDENGVLDDGNRRRPCLSVAPRRNCIVIPALRQKFTLNNDNNNGNDDQHDDGGKSTTKPADKTTMIQRGDCILLVSNSSQQRQPRAMVMRFRSRQECHGFSAAFLRHNPPKRSLAVPSSSSRENTVITRQHRPNKQQHNHCVMSHVTRLLHDSSFLSFVSNLESHIVNSDDGSKMMEELVPTAPNSDIGAASNSNLTQQQQQQQQHAHRNASS
eukprot:CAMPEP_0198113622 /NCGR_PEP_ID=MMETSP1442-20131203/5250_1 /TAXON_ID= /ORGANISM="Craspedostauros australis, Strain CCMP3328" /LENGTH=273 /DNA_ID=CAMNT_0043770763 /DNA_START=304 /DNA_END=1125 /DNA_ORIENTATION=-